MMFAKTVCNKPGSYVHVVPLGLVATLQFNKDGLVEKIYAGYEKETEFTLEQFKKAVNFIPTVINTTGGTTWVDGVFYPTKLSTAGGNLPECAYSEYLSKLESGESFSFYAGHVTSYSVNLQGALAIRNWLSINKFNTLPGSVVSFNMSADSILNMIATGNYRFKYPHIAGFMIYNGLEYEYIPSGLRQCTVKSVSKSITPEGYLQCTVKTDADSLELSYSDVANYDIQTGTCITYYPADYPEILAVEKTDSKKREPVPSTIVCPVCKKHYVVPVSGPVQCDDPECPSRMFPRASRMVNVLKLAEFPYSRFKEAVESHDVSCLTDILYLPENRDNRPQVTLAEAIKSVTPVDVCVDDNFFNKFANSCGNSVETVMYYAQNPLRIETDLNITSVQGKRFVEWLQDATNILTLQTVFISVDIIRKSKKFDGCPMFLGKQFAITGKFKHGSAQDICDILASYAGQVTDTVGDSHAVIVGSLHEEVDGAVIREAKTLGIPVFEEDDFFSWNSIESDLAANLL